MGNKCVHHVSGENRLTKLNREFSLTKRRKRLTKNGIDTSKNVEKSSLIPNGCLKNFRKARSAHINRHLLLPDDDFSETYQKFDPKLFYPNNTHPKTSNNIQDSTYWYPPESYWSRLSSLPYGWETAVDHFGRTYYINHILRLTTYNDPREDCEPDEEGIKPRDVELIKNPELGFGFVAGSEKPVIVRFVTEGGPSVGKLLPGDQIIRVNGEYVEQAPRERVIELIRNCKERVLLTVCQPSPDNSARKSALLSASKKAKLKNKPSRVRFAERVTINGYPMTGATNQPYESYVHVMANILKVFLENGQTKSFKYDNKTTVKDVLEILKEKLSLKNMDYFCLVLQHLEDNKYSRLTLLHEDDLLSKIALRPGAQYFRCLFRVIFAPQDPQEMYNKDKSALDYFYIQSCNDILNRRFRNTIKTELVLKLCSLSIYLHCQKEGIAKSTFNKLTTKRLEKDFPLEKFVPESVFKTLKRKEVYKKIVGFIKKNMTSLKALNDEEIKLQYLKIISSDVVLYGAQCYSAVIKEKNLEIEIVVSPSLGISYYKDFLDTDNLVKLATYGEIKQINIIREVDMLQNVEIKCEGEKVIYLKMNIDESEDIVVLIQGYYKLLFNKILPAEIQYLYENEKEAPPYYGKHIVQSSGWNYPNYIFAQNLDMEHIIDLSSGPPPFHNDLYKRYVSQATQTNGHLMNQPNVIIRYSEIFSDLSNTPDASTALISLERPHPNTKSIEVMTEPIPKIDTESQVSESLQDFNVDKKTLVGSDSSVDFVIRDKSTQSQISISDITNSINQSTPALVGNEEPFKSFVEVSQTDTESIYTSPEPSPRHKLNLPKLSVIDVRCPNGPLMTVCNTTANQVIEPSFGLMSPDKYTPIIDFYQSNSLLKSLKNQSIFPVENQLRLPSNLTLDKSKGRNSFSGPMGDSKIEKVENMVCYDIKQPVDLQEKGHLKRGDYEFKGKICQIKEENLVPPLIEAPSHNSQKNNQLTLNTILSLNKNMKCFTSINGSEGDIIDLTMIPLPKTPDQEYAIQFPVNTNFPPPPDYMTDASSKSIEEILSKYSKNIDSKFMQRSYSDGIIQDMNIPNTTYLQTNSSNIRASQGLAYISLSLDNLYNCFEHIDNTYNSNNLYLI